MRRAHDRKSSTAAHAHHVRQNRRGTPVNVIEWVMVSVIPAVGFLILWRVIDRWGRKHDPMQHSDLDHLSPGSADRSRSSFDD